MLTGKRILIVEDDPAIQDAIRTMLERKGYEIACLGNAEPLLEADFSMPDLIILDKQLPGADGIEVCHILKSRDATRSVPVLMLSASPQTAVLAQRAGAEGFLEKPFSMRMLREKVEELLLRAPSGND
jgi:DNA-binding response OmpR family regulator